MRGFYIKTQTPSDEIKPLSNPNIVGLDFSFALVFNFFLGNCITLVIFLQPEIKFL